MTVNISASSVARANKKLALKSKIVSGEPTPDLDPARLLAIVRDGLVSANMNERAEFVNALEESLIKEVRISIRSYLVPLGIPGRAPEDLTPSEVGHLCRFIAINLPQAVPVLLGTMNRFSVFESKL